jgi:aspartate aminotransferase-like enzyme
MLKEGIKMKNYLFTPGPTNVPESVLLEIAKPIIHHRTKEFEEIFAEARNSLKNIFGTSRDVLILSGSGTLAMEASIVNTLSANDTVLVINGGKFGERWYNIAQSYGLQAIVLDVEWGCSAKVDDIMALIKKNPSIKAILIQASETSTTTCHPIREIGNALRSIDGPLLIVDGITFVGVSKTEMDNWGIDVLVTGSQKALMLPPGLSFIAISEKAENAMKKSNLPKYYLDLKRELKAQRSNTTAYTPAVSLICGLKKSLELIYEEGLNNVYKRHKIMAEATRAGVKALGLSLLSKGIPSDAATGIIFNNSISKDIITFAKKHFGVYFAGGQGHLSEQVIRISHMGYHFYLDVISGLTALEIAINKVYQKITLGTALAAAENIISGSLNGK